MPDMEKIVSHLNDCMEASRRDNTWLFVRKDIVEDAISMLKEQEEDIIAMSSFLESHGWDSDSICGKNVEIVVTNGEDDDA